MKLEKKHWMIIGVVVAIILVWYFFLRKKKTESSYRIKSGKSETAGPNTCKCVNGDKECPSGYCGICCDGLGGVKL